MTGISTNHDANTQIYTDKSLNCCCYFFMDLVIPIKQWTIVGNLNDLQILQDWTRETWKLISKCVWTEVGWSNQTNVDWNISAPSQKVQFEFQNDCKSNSDIYTPGWLFHLAFTEIRKKFIGFKLSLSGMILYLPHLNIFHSLTVLGKEEKKKVPNWSQKYSLKRHSWV